MIPSIEITTCVTRKLVVLVIPILSCTANTAAPLKLGTRSPDNHGIARERLRDLLGRRLAVASLPDVRHDPDTQ